MLRRQALHAFTVLAFVGFLKGQTAQITGRITDSARAVIVGAQVSVVNTETGVRRELLSNEEGYYTAPLLARGTYSVQAKQPGFKESLRTGLSLDEGQVLRIDFTMEVGQVSERVEVSGAAPLLETENATVSTVVTNQKILDMPTVGRNPLQFALLVPGVRAAGSYGDLPVSAFSGGRAAIGGGGVSTNNYMVDGIAAENFTSGSLQTPLSVDATEEFRLIVRTPSAEYGRTGGGIINLISKSGTNAFHGSLYEFNRNKVLRANDFFSNRASRPRQPFNFNQYGATLGGPIRKDKTFFFFNWEQFKQRTLATTIRTVPTALQREGDFSQTFTNTGALVQIFDPLSTRPDPNNPANRIRDQFPGNRIPANRISPTARAVNAFFPAPNQAGTALTNANNFFGVGSSPIDKDIYGLRLDHYLTPLRRLAGRYTWDKVVQGVPNFFGNVAETGTSDLPLQRHSAFVSFSDALRPNLLFDIRGGLNFYLPNRVTRSFGFDVSQLALPARLNSQMQVPSFPRFNLGADMAAIGADQGDTLVQSNKAWSYTGTLTWIRGAHTWKFGSDNRVYQLNNTQGAAGATFDFSRAFTQGPNPNTTGATSGFTYASFMLGTPSGGQIGYGAPVTETVKNFALFAQDDWKVTPRLTLNLGLRWEVEGGITDRHGAISNFDPDVISQVNGVTLRGGLAFPGVNGLSRGHRDAELTNFQPRLGAAWQFLPRTVLRAGYGITYLPTSGIYVGLDRSGFSLNTPLLASTDGGFTPFETLANPFPNGRLDPVGSSQGALTLLGQSISGNLRDLRRGYAQQWGLSLQRELPGNWLVELGYMGNRGTKLPGRRTFDYLPEQFRALGTGLQTLVDNPYFGIIPATLPLGQRQVARANLLDTYPQFAGASGYATLADSIYHAGTLRIEKRFSGGLSVLVAYTFSKLIDNNTGDGGNNFAESGDNGVRNWDNLDAERSVSSNDLPQRLVVSTSYELPFGRTSQPFVRALLGGWQINAITSFQSGNVIGVTQNATAFGSSKPNVVGDPSLDNPTIDNWLNRAAFVNAPAFTFGNVGRNLPRTRSDGQNNIDLSLMKTFSIREQIRLQFRAESFNLTNTPVFGNPAANIDAGNFGTVTGFAANNTPRNFQLALKLYF
jgi:outer membrane receptor protein involved in Fe transport